MTESQILFQFLVPVISGIVGAAMAIAGVKSDIQHVSKQLDKLSDEFSAHLEFHLKGKGND